MNEEYKVKQLLKDKKRSAFRKYRDIYYGDASLCHVIKSEIIITLFSGISGAMGLFLRKKFFPCLFKSIGKGVVFGKNITLRHSHKITIGNNVIIDDNCVIDAKGESNRGIVIEDDAYIGRNTIVYCKNGNITIEKAANISSNCQIYSSNEVTIGHHSVIAAFVYILSGGEYDIRDKTLMFAEQSGMNTKGPTVLGANCWLGAGVIMVDGTTIGEHCVIGAGAVVAKSIPANSLAVGIPAKVIQSLENPHLSSSPFPRERKEVRDVHAQE